MEYIDKTSIQTAIQSSTPILIEFRSFECPACLKAESFLNVLSKAYHKKLIVNIVNVDLDAQKMFSINKVPLCILFKQGREITRIEGFNNEFVFEKLLQDALKSC